MVHMFTAEELQLLDSAAEEEEDEACPICCAFKMSILGMIEE